MAEIKTKVTNIVAEDFITDVENKKRREDALVLLDMFKRVTKLEPRMWGPSMIGFGKYHYKTDRSNQEGDWPLVAFSPRKQNLTLYVDPNRFPELLQNLGKYKTSVACLYINKLEDINLVTLENLITASYTWSKQKYNS